jgi:hypothetical protein
MRLVRIAINNCDLHHYEQEFFVWPTDELFFPNPHFITQCNKVNVPRNRLESPDGE